jgi:GNAT superfamily N-acetyltransferase
VRPANEQDGPAIVALAEVAGGLGSWGVAQRSGPDRPDQARFVEEDGGEVVAYGCVWRRRHGTYGLDTLVAPGHRGRGLGRTMVDRLFEELDVRGASAVESRVDVDHGDALQFLMRRGFFELARVERVRLDLDRVEAVDERAPPGVDVATLAAARDEGTERALHALVTTAFRERPMRRLEPFVETPIDEFVAELDRAIADGCFLATLDGELIGFSGLVPGPEEGTVREFMTAVRPDLRDRGIGTTLVRRAIGYARGKGYRAVFSTSPNRAMQAVNERLGFARYAPTEIRMGRRLTM